MEKADKVVEAFLQTESHRKIWTGTQTECPDCGLAPIQLQNGHECIDGYIHFEKNGRKIAALCPNMKRKLFLDSCRSALGDSGITEPYLKKTFEKFDPRDNPAEFEIVKKWSANPSGWLFIYGDVGTGKTHLACAAMQSAIMTGLRGCFASAPDILWEVQPSASQAEQIMKRLMNVEILALDDLGAHRDTPFAVEVLFRILNLRYMAAAPTIITSNWTLKDMADHGIDWKRIADRILEMTKPDRAIRLIGGSKR